MDTNNENYMIDHKPHYIFLGENRYANMSEVECLMHILPEDPSQIKYGKDTLWLIEYKKHIQSN